MILLPEKTCAKCGCTKYHRINIKERPTDVSSTTIDTCANCGQEHPRTSPRMRTRFHDGFGTAEEVQSLENGKWYHVRWISGPIAAYQQCLRIASRSV